MVANTPPPFHVTGGETDSQQVNDLSRPHSWPLAPPALVDLPAGSSARAPRHEGAATSAILGGANRGHTRARTPWGGQLPSGLSSGSSCPLPSSHAVSLHTPNSRLRRCIFPGKEFLLP